MGFVSALARIRACCGCPSVRPSQELSLAVVCKQASGRSLAVHGHGLCLVRLSNHSSGAHSCGSYSSQVAARGEEEQARPAGLEFRPQPSARLAWSFLFVSHLPDFRMTSAKPLGLQGPLREGQREALRPRPDLPHWSTQVPCLRPAYGVRVTGPTTQGLPGRQPAGLGRAVGG